MQSSSARHNKQDSFPDVIFEESEQENGQKNVYHPFVNSSDSTWLPQRESSGLFDIAPSLQATLDSSAAWLG